MSVYVARTTSKQLRVYWSQYIVLLTACVLRTLSYAMDGQTGPASVNSPSTSTPSPSISNNQHHHFHAAARLQLAAALLEYDYEQDGKLAEHSAIFAPYRQEPLDYPSPRGAGLAAAVADLANNVSAVPDEALVVDHDEHGHHQRGSITRSIVDYSTATLEKAHGYTLHDDRSSTHPKSFDFLSPKSDNGLVNSPDIADPKNAEGGSRPSTTLAIYTDPEVNDDELASEWGLDNVVSKFEKLDSNAFRMEASKMKAAAAVGSSSSSTTTNKLKNKTKARKRSGTSGSDILLHLPDATFTKDTFKRNILKDERQEQEEEEEEEEELDPIVDIDSHSAPTILNFNMNKRKLRHRSGSELKAARKSFESELEMAFSSTSGGEIDDGIRGAGAAAASDNGLSGSGNGGGRSRSSSIGTFNNNDNFISPEIAKSIAKRAIADYAAEEVARPLSSLSMKIQGESSNSNNKKGYISRFDPKAIAKQREEELSTRPRFPNSLNPKILIMPAPLSELEAAKKLEKEEEEARKKEQEVENMKVKPRIEREAGKLYGKSLMDELNFRKERQKLRNRAFRGDSRVAMMDMKRFKSVTKVPSPLSTPSGPNQLFNSARGGVRKYGQHNDNEDIDDQEEEDDDDDDDDKPLRPSGSSAPISDDPWIKYTSHRSLANVAKGKSSIDTSKPAKDGARPSTISPALASPDKRKSISPGLDTRRHTLSTAELQQQYKKNRQSMLALDQYRDGDNNHEASEDDEDDDVPLGTRQEQLTASQNQRPSSPNSPLTPIQQQQQKSNFKNTTKEVQSVFGVDLVMQKELAKLEEILKIEEAERKIKLERERIKNAEKLAKEVKKKAKAEKKERKKKKRKMKEKNTKDSSSAATAAGAHGEDGTIENHTRNKDIDEEMNMQRRTENRSSVGPVTGDVHPQSPPYRWQDDHQRQSYYSRRATGEVDDFYGGGDIHRQSMLPDELEEGALTPRPIHTRSSSFAPCLTLSFLAGDSVTGATANNADTTGWFASEEKNKGNGSDNDGGSDREEEEERIRCKSPFGINNFASDTDDDDEHHQERADITAIWAEGDSTTKQDLKMREVIYDPSKKPELNRMSVAGSFAGILDGFGIGKSGEHGSDEEDDGKENHKTTSFARRLSVHKEDDDSDSEEDEGRPLSAILLGNSRKSQAFQSITGTSSSTRVAFEPPRLDLPLDFAIAAKEDSDSEAEDEAPLALKRLNVSLTAGTQGRTFDSEETGNEEDSEEDDLPLAIKQDDNKPLGQAHPVAALSQQMELQQQQNAALIAHMQLQYQYALQMQLQQAIIQQADIQGYTASQLNFVQPAQALSGAASDIGLDLGPDPKLVNSVDRWRQGVE